VSWIVRFQPASARAVSGGLLDDRPALVSRIWDLGANAIVEQPATDATASAALIAGFDDPASAHRAVRMAADWGYSATVDPVDTPWHSDAPSQVTISTIRGPVALTLIAGPTFGHGSHPTTELALELLSRSVNLDRPPGRVLDLGTGSGVLAIAAHHLGAKSITAIDLDPAAVDTAKANFEANGVVARCSTVAAEDLVGESGEFDTVLINVLVSAHERLAPSVGRLLARRGRLIVSGFLEHQQTRVINAYQRARPTLRELTTVSRDEWIGSLLGQPPGYPPPESEPATADAG